MKNPKLHKGDTIYLKPNAKKIQFEIDKKEKDQHQQHCGWNTDMDRLVGKFHTLGCDQRLLIASNLQYVDIDGWSIYVECIDFNILPNAKL